MSTLPPTKKKAAALLSLSLDEFHCIPTTKLEREELSAHTELYLRPSIISCRKQVYGSLETCEITVGVVNSGCEFGPNTIIYQLRNEISAKYVLV